MAQVILGAAGSALGASLLPQGLSLLGATVSGAALGSMAGAIAGAAVDGLVMGALAPTRQGPRLQQLYIQGSSEGTPLPVVYGRARVAGQVIWAARFGESSATQRSGKGTPRSQTFSYTLSFAVGLCEGPIAGIGRVWADGKVLNTANLAMRVYTGDEGQDPDPAIEAVEGADNAPAYRGMAYVVFEDLPLAPFGNRLPQLSFEVIARPEALEPERDLNTQVKSICLIPGAGEFVYATDVVKATLGPGRAEALNSASGVGQADVLHSLDQLAADFPNLEVVNIVVSWFGTDLRAASCQIKPRVEVAVKTTTPLSWQVNGIARGAAHVVSQVDGAPAYGGTPADAAVLQLIAALKARGYRVGLYPFLMMDIPSGNTLPNPYGGTGQAAYPWRGRITCHPAAGQAGTVDKTAPAATQVASFFGTCTPAHFAASGQTVNYSGPAEWSFRRLILHYAKLSTLAGGVDQFILGSELRGLTTVRSSTSTYPAVAALQALAADVRTVVGAGVELTYAADWSEYFGHQPQDGSGDVYFHLDPLWADSAIDCVGIDWYPPISDWRDSDGHLDSALALSIYDPDYLDAGVTSGEGFDWYYASDADRHAQIRTAITDGAYGEPWVFRPKDLASWWSHLHHNRPGGVRSATSTAWVAGMKPVRLIEVGVPAVDKGANTPNLFTDPKSTESAWPTASTGGRDDLIQRRALEALLCVFKDSAHNPQSTVYTGAMIPADGISLWAWDARPFPDFPVRRSVWADGDAWVAGHWLNGRAGQVPLADLIVAIVQRAGGVVPVVDGVAGLVGGYVIDRAMSGRAALEPLLLAHGLMAVERDGRVCILPRIGPVDWVIDDGDIVAGDDAGPQPQFSRPEHIDQGVRVRTLDMLSDYRLVSAAAGPAAPLRDIDIPLVMDRLLAEPLAQDLYARLNAGDARVALALGARHLAAEVGDIVAYADRIWRMTEAHDAAVRGVTLVPVVLPASAPARVLDATPADAGTPAGEPVMVVLDLPPLTDRPDDDRPKVAVYAQPWSHTVVRCGPSGDALSLIAEVSAPAVIGELVWDLYPGPVHRWDRGNRVRVRLYGGVLGSQSALAVLNGANRCAIQHSSGAWEVMQFQTATLVGAGEYELGGLLRGQAGTEYLLDSVHAAGSRFVVLDDAVVPVRMDGHLMHVPVLMQAEMATGGVSTTAFTWAGQWAQPFSPGHVRAVRLLSGDIRISWVRRARLNGDTWVGEVPVGADGERFVLRILSGAAVVREQVLSTSEHVWTVAEQAVDFPLGLPSPLHIEVTQRTETLCESAAATTVFWP
jgi:hypothetical protein